MSASFRKRDSPQHGLAQPIPPGEHGHVYARNFPESYAQHVSNRMDDSESNSQPSDDSDAGKEAEETLREVLARKQAQARQWTERAQRTQAMITQVHSISQ